MKSDRGNEGKCFRGNLGGFSGRIERLRGDGRDYGKCQQRRVFSVKSSLCIYSTPPVTRREDKDPMLPSSKHSLII